jgi:quercetin dioxygenase-like cupin family protein
MTENPVREIAVLINTHGVRVIEFELSPNVSGAWHHHSVMFEHCYCLKGRLTIELKASNPIILDPGDKCEFAPGVKHRIRNEGNQIATYLVIQGIGEYDFVQS